MPPVIKVYFNKKDTGSAHQRALASIQISLLLLLIFEARVTVPLKPDLIPDQEVSGSPPLPPSITKKDGHGG